MILISLLLIVISPIIQSRLSSLRIKNKFPLSIGLIAVIMFFVGIASSILSSIVFLMSLGSQFKCVTGFEGFAVLGILITFITTPTIYRKYNINKKLNH